jgi:hypothetical protein
MESRAPQSEGAHRATPPGADVGGGSVVWWWGGGTPIAWAQLGCCCPHVIGEAPTHLLLLHHLHEAAGTAWGEAASTPRVTTPVRYTCLTPTAPHFTSHALSTPRPHSHISTCPLIVHPQQRFVHLHRASPIVIPDRAGVGGSSRTGPPAQRSARKPYLYTPLHLPATAQVHAPPREVGGPQPSHPAAPSPPAGQGRHHKACTALIAVTKLTPNSLPLRRLPRGAPVSSVWASQPAFTTTAAGACTPRIDGPLNSHTHAASSCAGPG